MPRTLPQTTIEHNGETFRIPFKWELDCKHCDHTGFTASQKDRISCGHCNRKNPRSQLIGKYYENYHKHALFTGDEEGFTDVIGQFRRKADQYEAMAANGWEFVTTTRDSRIRLRKDETPTTDASNQ